MAYVDPNFKTKTALKNAVKEGKRVTVFSNSHFNDVPQNGRVYVEGPHYPEPHKWYAQVIVQDGQVIKVS